MIRSGVGLWALSLAFLACDNQHDVFLGSALSGSGGNSGSGGGASGGACTMCGNVATFSHPSAPSNAATLFADARKQPRGVSPEREPELIYPNHETKFPSNVPSARCEWRAGSENTLFELQLRGERSAAVVYTAETSWQPADDLWDAVWTALARENVGRSVLLSVRALDSNGAVFESAPVSLFFGAPLRDGPIYYWSTTARGLMRSELRADALPQRLTLPTDGKADTGCSGCHALASDGKHLAFDDGAGLQLADLMALEPTLVAAGSGGADAGTGKMDKLGPDAPAVWPAFSPDGTRILLAAQGELALLDANGAPVSSEMVTLPGKAVAAHPSWSPLGDRVVFTLAEKGTARFVEKGQIASMSFADDRFGPIEILVPNEPGAENNLFPAVSPDGNFVAFVSTRAKSYNSAPGTLRLLRLSDRATFTLERLNARVNNQDAIGNVGNSMPSWVPATDAGSLWLSFSSARAYAGVRPQDPKRDQLWIAAIDPTQDEPSLAAFWAPFQRLSQANHRAQWGPASVGAQCGCHELCGDAIDNDCDGSADEADCVATCALEDICDDGIDNDCDCVIDDCNELCDDAIDNDRDGYIDAADPLCGGKP
ncbi:MAG: hypothetical protein ACOY0T_31745 [Myxococcota bacterium]